MGGHEREIELDYATALRRLREDMGATLVDLSERALISPSYLSELERGIKRPSTDVLARLAAALGMPPSSLLAYVESLTALLEETEAGERGAQEREHGARLAASIHPSYLPDRPSRAYRGRALMEEPGAESGQGREATLWALLRTARGLPDEDVRLLVELARRMQIRRP